MTEQNGKSSQLTLSTNQGTPDPLSGKLEAMDTGALASSLSWNLRIPPRVFSEEEDTGESRPAHLGPAKGETVRGSDTVASTKRKAQVGLYPSWFKMMIFNWVVFPADSSSVWYL